MKYIYILLLMCGLLSCNNAMREENKNSPSLYYLKIDKPNFSSLKPLLLSEFVDSIEYVQLETTPDCFLPYYGSRKMCQIGDFLFFDGISSIFQFDANTGEFLRQIGRRGEGPGEYVQVMNAVIDEDNNIVYVKSPNRPSSLLSYSFKGDYLGDLQLVDTEYFLFSNCFHSLGLVYIDNQYAVFRASFMPKEQACQPFDLIVYDYRNQKIKYTLANEMGGVFNLHVTYINGLATFSNYEDVLLHKSFYNDTLYSVHLEKGIEPYAIIDLGKRKFHVDAVFDPSDNVGKVGKITINDILINNDCIYIACMLMNDESFRSSSWFLYKFDIHTGESTHHSLYLLNDLDGGNNTSISGLSRKFNPVTPLDVVEKGKEENLIFSNLSKSKLKYPELKDKFDIMQSKRDPDDNPLLMKFYLKQNKNE